MRTLTIVDYDSIYNSCSAQNISPNPAKLAQGIRQSVQLIDPGTELLAFGNWQHYPDVTSIDGEFIPAAWAAFDAEKFSVQTGDKHMIISQIASVIGQQNATNQLIVVTDDEQLSRIIGTVRQNRPDMTVRVWGTKQAGSALRTLPYFVDLQEQEQFGLKIKRGLLIIDWENLYIGVNKMGYSLQPDMLIEILNSYADKQGQIIERWAFADFGALSKVHGQEGYQAQATLEMNHVSTRYVVSSTGKNSSDMRIVSEINSIVDKTKPDVLVLVSSDQDFRPMIEKMKRRCQITILAVKGALSMEMSRIPGVRVDFIEDQLPTENKRKTSTRMSNRHGLSPHVAMVVLLNEQMQKRNWKWITVPNTHQILLEHGGGGTTPVEVKRLIKDASDEGIIIGTQETVNGTMVEAYRIDPKHETVATAHTILDVLRYRMNYTHTVKKYPTVREGYILRGLNDDDRLKEKGIVISPAAGRGWLELAVSCGILEVEEVLDDTKPGIKVNMYRLPRQEMKPLTVLQVSTDDVESMTRRLITACDLMMAINGQFWASLKTLDRHLASYGRAVFFKAVDDLITSGAAFKQQFDNRNSAGHPVTGLVLKAEAKQLGSIRNQRRTILEQLMQMHNNGQSITIPTLLNSNESIKLIGESTCRNWLDILHQERVLTHEGGTEKTYRLNVTHHLVRTEGNTATQIVSLSKTQPGEQNYLHPAA